MKLNKKTITLIGTIAGAIAFAGFKTLDLFNQIKDLDMNDPFEVDIDDE